MYDSYDGIVGYEPEADLQLGCGIPTKYAVIKSGDTIVDLGSGAGNDVFVARSIVGDNGYVIGIDMTEEMVYRANLNKSKLGFTNIEFKLGEIENIPIEDNLADVVLSNCVLNLVPNKKIAFSEIYRILKPGCHFCVSDIVLIGKLPSKIKASASLYTCCIAGAISKDEYVQIIKDAGFSSVSIKSEKRILISNEFLEKYLTAGEIKNFKKNQNEIISITIVAYKN